MKSKDISRRYGLDNASFETWLRGTRYRYKVGVMGGIDVSEHENINHIVSEFRVHTNEQRRLLAAEQAQAARDAEAKRQALAAMLITSGFSFDGYTITRYSGYISGDDVMQVDRGQEGVFARATNVGDSLMASLADIRRNALTELKEAAHALGCNAVIGVDFDYLTLDPQTATSSGGTVYLPYVFGVTANGNAVVIEKNDRASGAWAPPSSPPVPI